MFTRKHRKQRPIWLRLLLILRNSLFVFALVTITLTFSLRWMNPPYTVFMLSNNSLNNFPSQIRWVAIHNVSPDLLISVIASEDQKFPTHYGFDFKEIYNAVQNNKKSQRKRGASTISQQVAKNIFLWPDKSLLRKGLEAYFTVLIEALWPKWRILEVYVNVAEFAPNTYGIKNASYYLFGHHPAQITSYESALLAAVMPNPHKLHAANPSAYVKQRANEITLQVESLGGQNYLANIWD